MRAEENGAQDKHNQTPITDEKELSHSEIDRMAQEAENYRVEDEANESKDEAENGSENVEKFENDAGYATSEDKTTFETHFEANGHFPPSISRNVDDCRVRNMRTARSVCRWCPSRRVAIVILGSRRRTSTERRYVKTSTIVAVQLLSDLETTIQEGVEAKRLHKSFLLGVSRKRVILLLMYRTEQEDRADLVEELGATNETITRRLMTSHEVSQHPMPIRRRQTPSARRNDVYASDEPEDVIPPTHSMATSGKKLTDVRKNGDGDLRWLRPNGKTQVTIEYVPQAVDEVVEVVRLIPQESVQQRTVEQIVRVSVPQVGEEISEVVQITPQDRISERIIDRIVDVPVVVMQRQVPIIQTVQKTVGVPQVQFLD